MPFNWTIFFRRISALFVFFVVLATFILLFYYKYVPGNREELNQRGHRVLTQLIQNFLRKDQDLHNIIENAGAGYANIVRKNPPYDRLNANMHYDTVIKKNTLEIPHLQATDTGAWIIQHHSASVIDTNLTKTYLTVKVKDFADPIFSTRADIFQNYLILYDSTALLPAGSANVNKLCLIYQQNMLSASADVNTDTLQSLAKNTDESGVFYLSLSGEKYVAFFAHFAFHQQPLVLAGLIPKDTYERKVEATPIYFLPLIIIVVCLILIALPYLKVFLLSPMEPINSFDVLKTATSFYAGAVVLTIIVFYFFLNYVTDTSLQSRLRHFSSKVQSDLETEIRQANQQLKDYDSNIGKLPPDAPLKNGLTTDNTVQTKPNTWEEVTDMDCMPHSYPAVTRLMWLDTTGRTIAKWNPFNYPTPFTHVNNYVFFQQLEDKPAWFNGVAGYDQPVLYPGKSNLTDEFLTFIGRQSVSSSWPDKTDSLHPNHNGSTVSTPFIAIAAALHSTLQPVMPKGFGFCLIDNSGKVLIDGDNHRSLGENLFVESDNNRELLDAVRYNNSGIAFPVELYGDPYVARATPIAGQPLHLVCFYNQKIFIGNIDRFLHFSIHTLALIWILLSLCLLLSTYGQWKPVLLNFRLDKEEWIRPSSTDKQHLAYMFRYFSKLLFLSVVFFLLIAMFSSTLIPLFYTALFLPFYTLAGVQNAHQWKGRIYTVTAIVILNVLMLLLISGSGKDYSQVIAPLLFQGCAVLLPWPRWQPKQMYFPTLYLSIALIGILPTLGILSYGFYAEKIQYKKYKLAQVATDFFQRSNYLQTNLLPSYQPEVLDSLGKDFQQQLLFRNSIYLTDNDTIETVDAGTPLPQPKHDLPDGLYALLMDKWYLAPQLWQDDLSIPDASPDGEWLYQIAGNHQVEYASTQPVGNDAVGHQNIRIQSHILKPQDDLAAIWPVAFCSALLLLALVLLAGQLIAGAINRLFLMDIIHHMKEIAVDKKYLEKYFVPAALVGPPSYLTALNFQVIPFSIDFLKYEKSFDAWPVQLLPKPECDQSEFILALADLLAPVYEKIWKDLPPEERYILHDFANDRYTNYKNSTILYKLIGKGILSTDNEVPDVFSLSFRQYVLSSATAADMIKLDQQFSLPGTWQSIRIPVISILVVMGIFLFRTQPEIATFVAGLATFFGSISTILTLLPKANSTS